MPSPLNTPTSESIPISIFDTVVDIELDEKQSCHQMASQRFATQTPASFMGSKSPNGSTEDFFSRLRNDDKSENVTFASVTSASARSDLSPIFQPNSCDQLTASANQSETEKPSSENDLGNVINGIKSNLTLAFNAPPKMQDEPLSTELNKTGSIRFRRARLQLQLPHGNPLEVGQANATLCSSSNLVSSNGGQQCQHHVSSRQSVDSLDSTSSSVCSTASTSTGTTGSSSLERSTTDSIDSIHNSSANGCLTGGLITAFQGGPQQHQNQHQHLTQPMSTTTLLAPVSPCTGPKSAPIPLSLHTALTIDCSGPSTQESQPIFARRKRPVFNFFLNQSVGNIEAVRIDTSLPLERQGWFHGSISRVDAEELLHKTKMGSFLVRKCDQRRQNYSVAIKSYKGFMHIRIYQNAETMRFTLGQTCNEYFNSIPELIDYFTLHRLPISGAEYMQLIFPVEAQLL